MKKIIALVMLSVATTSFANYAFIQDPDGEVNVRAQPSLKARITGKLNNGTVVYCLNDIEKETFCDATYASLKADSAYIHKSRLNFFKGFQQWKYEKTLAHSAMYTLKQNRITISVKPAQFNRQDFKRVKTQDNIPLYSLYKNKPFFGTDGELPNQSSMWQLSEIKIQWNGQSIVVPQSNLEQYFFPNTPLAKGSKYDHEMSEIYSLGNMLYILNDLNIGGAAHYHQIVFIEDGKVKAIQAWNAM